jgi:hypothetical protein
MRLLSFPALLCCAALAGSVAGSAQTPAPSGLQAPSAFASISDPAERSRAMFAEAAKVLTRETTCMTCHTERNFTLAERASYRSIPGHPRWMVAPMEMAWEGKSVGEICRQIKDPSRNGGRDLALLHEHLAHDDLVAWGWQPGAGRDPAPGTQALLGELIQAWIDSGAQCP